MAETGLNWKLAVDTAESEGSPTFVDLPGQRGGNLTLGKSDVDATSKDRSGWEDSVTTRRNLSASADGIDDSNNAALLYLVDTNHFHATVVNKPVHLRMTNEDGDTWIFWATMEEFTYDFPESDLVSWSASFKARSSDNTGALSVPEVTRAA